MNTNMKFRATAAITAAIVAMSLSACTGNDTQSGTNSESGQLASPTATAAPTHTPDANDEVGEQINSINEKSGFYNASGSALNDPASGDYKQIKLPDGWESTNTVYYANGEISDESTTFDGIDKSKVLEVANKALLGTLDGERSYALTVETSDDSADSDLTTQMASIQDGYVQGKFDALVQKYISEGDATRTALETAVNSGSDDAITSIFTSTDETTSLENEFAGPYVPLKGGYTVKALGQDYNRIAIESLDQVLLGRMSITMNDDTFQPYLGAEKDEKLLAINVRLDYTYRIPLLDPETDTVKLSEPMYASTFVIVTKSANDTYSAWISGSNITRNVNKTAGNLDILARGAQNEKTVISPLG